MGKKTANTISGKNREADQGQETSPDLTSKGEQDLPSNLSAASDIEDFLQKAELISKTNPSTGKGRLLFAMDATMSRQPSWDMALSLQGEMFKTVKSIGNLSVQLMYFRGLNECRASKWVGDAGRLASLMTKVSCRGGRTQIRKVLGHAVDETAREKINAVVYVGDAMEENIDELCHRAGELKCFGVPVFIFQEGYDPVAQNAFREIAEITDGAYCAFDAGSASQLGELLKAVAAYAAGGVKAIELLLDEGNQSASHILKQIGKH